MFYGLGNLRSPNLIEVGEPAAGGQGTPWYRSRCCRVFSISFTCIGFLLCFTSSFYLMCLGYTENFARYFFFIVAAIIFLAMFVHLVAADSPPLNTVRPRVMTALPVQIASGDHFREALRRSHSERVASLIPERTDLVRSLPAYILIPAEPQDRDEASNASTESTLSADSSLERRHADASDLSATPEQVLRQPATDESSSATKLSEAAAVISKIVKESILDKEDDPSTVGTTTIDQSSDNSSEKESEVSREGVRQRKPSPIEAHKHISAPECERKE